jgi:hypothetical protein
LTSWDDLSGNDLHLDTNVGAGIDPIYKTGGPNGKPYVNFSGTSSNLSDDFADQSQPTTQLIAVRHTSAPTLLDAITDSIDGANRHLVYSHATNDDWAMSADWNSKELDSGIKCDTSVRVLACCFNSTESRLFLDGVLIDSGDAGSETMSGLTVGSTLSPSNYSDIELYEIGVYNALVASSDIGSATDILTTKWRDWSDDTGVAWDQSLTYHGNIIGEPTFVADVPSGATVNKSIDFDGTNDYVDCGMHVIGPAINGLASISCSCWIKFDAIDASASGNLILSIVQDGGGNGVQVNVDGSSNKVIVGSRSEAGDTYRSASSVATLSTGS